MVMLLWDVKTNCNSLSFSIVEGQELDILKLARYSVIDYYQTMQYAVFEFVEDKSCAVGETRWISGEDNDKLTNEKWFFNKEILLRWPCDSTRILKRLGKTPIDLEVETKMYSAKIVKLSGKFYSI